MAIESAKLTMLLPKFSLCVCVT